MTLLLLMSACASTVPSATEEVCEQWRKVLPTVSTADTDQTKKEVLLEREVFARVCGA